MITIPINFFESYDRQSKEQKHLVRQYHHKKEATHRYYLAAAVVEVAYYQQYPIYDHHRQMPVVVDDFVLQKNQPEPVVDVLGTG
ncbi:unnamed protein product [Ambrosiozyma monospora]|uniref:Unnamed protein product n=1 Tax=Ambrosiozyma monospora TaxID=43982 RepID=A0ACB5UDQ1_AMBMO|nr:unnamed protein product [Ambrosiozyma monospora]